MEKNVRLIIVILSVLIVVLAVTGGILYFTTDLFKSDEKLFKKYLAQDIKNFASVFDISNEEKNIDDIWKNDYTENSNIQLSFIENENDQEEFYNIKTEGINNTSEKSLYKNIEISYGSETLSHIELLRQNEVYGFRLSDLVQQFVSIENATMRYVVSNLGYNGKYFQERMNIDNLDFTGLFDFTDEEVEKLKQDYYNVIFSDINPKSYSSKSKAMITLNNGESPTTKQYTLTLSKTELDKIYKKVLNQAMNDQIILSKLEKIDNEIIEIGLVEPEGESLKDRYIAKLQEKYDSIEYLGQNDEMIKFNVFQAKGTTYRVSMITDMDEYYIDFNNKNGKGMSLKKVKLTQEGQDTSIYSFNKDDNNSKHFSYKDDKQELKINLEEQKPENKLNIIGNILYTNDKIKQLNTDINLSFDFSGAKQIEAKFEDNNNIILNDYDSNVIENLFANLRDRVIKKLEEKQSIINTKMLNNILLWIDKKENERINEEKDNQELAKQRFNNKFNLYEGENVDIETTKKLLSAAGKNMSQYEVIDGKIKLLIQAGAKNEEDAEKISKTLEKAGRTYNIKLEYAEDGYINAIIISVYEKK